MARKWRSLNMSFEWNRIHKWEENIEREVSDAVYEYVCEFYGVEDIDQLTLEQAAEIQAFRDELNEYSVMQIGFSNILMQLEDTYYEDD